VLPKAKAAALKALERDEESRLAHVALGMVRLLYEWDWNGALREFERALQIGPNHPGCRTGYALWLNTMGRQEEAIAEMIAAVDLDPLSSVASFYLASVYSCAGYEDRAIEQLLKTVGLNPAFAPSYGQLAALYARKGRYEKALDQAEKYLTVSGNDLRSRSLLAQVYAISGKREEALACMEELKKEAASHAVGGFAFLYAALGDSEQTFACLEKSWQERDVFLVFLPILREFRHLHGDPRFTDLLHRIGLPVPP
jgi:tetratricopeptide (TPR) repeat protein